MCTTKVLPKHFFLVDTISVWNGLLSIHKSNGGNRCSHKTSPSESLEKSVSIFLKLLIKKTAFNSEQKIIFSSKSSTTRQKKNVNYYSNTFQVFHMGVV